MAFTQDAFEALEEAFNTARDKSAFYVRCDAQDTVIIYPYKGPFHGKQALVSFWNAGVVWIIEAMWPLD